MLKKKVEKIIGPVTDGEFKEAMKIATDDIKQNNIPYKIKTNQRFTATIIAASVKLLRGALRLELKEKAAQ